MLKEIRSLLSAAISSLAEEGKLSSKDSPKFQVEHARQKGHGDIASNVALVLAKHVGMNSRDLAEQIVQHLPPSSLIERSEIAGPGFINFFLASNVDILGIKHVYFLFLIMFFNGFFFFRINNI